VAIFTISVPRKLNSSLPPLAGVEPRLTERHIRCLYIDRYYFLTVSSIPPGPPPRGCEVQTNSCIAP